MSSILADKSIEGTDRSLKGEIPKLPRTGKTRTIVLFSLLAFCYLLVVYKYPEYMAKITPFAFSVMLILMGLIWHKEKAVLASLEKVTREARFARVKLKEGYFSTMKSLALTIETKDPYTRGHSARVVDYALLISDELGLSQDEKVEIRNAGILHDIGKVAIADHILGKPGTLSEEEMEVIKKHPGFGVDILTPLPFLKGELSIILEHHERVDGNGYHNVDEKDIPLASRIIAVADSYDAMTSDRPYRKAYSKEKAIQELKENTGSQFDPQVVEAFLSALSKKET